jgi:hypothetical protein
MAVIALVPIGAALFSGAAAGSSAAAIAMAGAIGGGIFGAVGSYLDQAVLFPAIFGRNNQVISGPKIDDWQLTTGSPGSPIHFCMGRENRVPGTIIWISKVRDVKEEDSEGGGKGGGGTTVVSHKYFVDLAIALCEGPISAVKRMWADGKILYTGIVPEGTLPNRVMRYDSVTIYNGAEDQLPSPIIEAWEGVGNVPAFRGIAYVVFKNFALHQFGNRLPNFSFEIEADPQLLLSQAVEKLVVRAGRPVTTVNTTWAQGEEVRGYDIVGPQSPVKSIEPLMVAFDLVCQELDGVLHFRKRIDTLPIQMDPGKLASAEEGSDTPRKMRVTITAGFDLPGEVNVQYLDPALDLQKGSVKMKRLNIVAPTSATFDLPLVMLNSRAQEVAFRSLWSPWAERSLVELSLPPSMLEAVESDALEFDDQYGNPWRVRLTNVRRGANFLIEAKGVTEQRHTLVNPPVSEGSAPLPGEGMSGLSPITL